MTGTGQWTTQADSLKLHPSHDTHFSDLSSAVRCRTPGDEMELDIGMVETSVGELGGYPGQALKSLRVSKCFHIDRKFHYNGYSTMNALCVLQN